MIKNVLKLLQSILSSTQAQTQFFHIASGGIHYTDLFNFQNKLHY